MHNLRTKNIILAAGGTGGHIFPAEALAVELAKRGYTPILATDKRYEQYADVPAEADTDTHDTPSNAHPNTNDTSNSDTTDNTHPQCQYNVINSGSPSGNIFKRASGIVKLGLGYRQAVALLKRIEPDVVVGFGGYPSFPMMYAAIRRGYRTIIHEQNSLLGRVNYFLAPRVNAIATSFPEITGLDAENIGKVTRTGNPVRPAIKALRRMRYPQLSDNSILRIVVIGGSQGASVFSRVMPAAMKILPRELRHRIRIDQQCREADIEEVREKYDALGMSADLATFFADIPERMASAHLVVSRAGASSIAELAVAGRPAILVPYPHASDDHQMVNARMMEGEGGAWVMDEGGFTAEMLAMRMEELLQKPDALQKAAENARNSGQPDAAERLANLVERLADAADMGSEGDFALDETAYMRA